MGVSVLGMLDVMELQVVWDAFHLAAIILLPYKLHTSRSAVGKAHEASFKRAFQRSQLRCP